VYAPAALLVPAAAAAAQTDPVAALQAVTQHPRLQHCQQLQLLLHQQTHPPQACKKKQFAESKSSSGPAHYKCHGYIRMCHVPIKTSTTTALASSLLQAVAAHTSTWP
jgi:hypothetical protein